MTVAMILAAARIIELRHEEAATIVSFVEIGSEGAVLRFDDFRSGDQYLISRDGSVLKRA